MKFYVVDAFSSKPFKGNPAAVFLLDSFPPDNLMQSIAFELSLSDTAFVVPSEEHYNIRWFTPHVELNLCGHATLAASHILWNELREPSSEISYTCKSGILRTWKDSGSITMDFPANTVIEIDVPRDITELLGILPIAAAESGGCWIAELSSEGDIHSFVPDESKIVKLPCKALILTTKADSGSEFDFVSRFFGPKDGVLEDPVTGSAHCKLAPYWAQKLGRNKLSAYQASKRGGSLLLNLCEDRVHITGHAITVYEGNFKGVL